MTGTRSALVVLLACAVLATSGCASRRAAARAAAAAAQAPLLELRSEGEGPLRVKVERVAARPSATEYRMVIANDGDAPLTIEGLDRLATQGPPVASSASLDELEARTAAFQGLIALGTVKTAAAAAGAATAVGAVGSFYSAVGLSTMGAAITAVSVVMVPAVIVGGVALMAAQAKRSQPLANAFIAPAELAPREARSVSAYFPVMPTATMLIARYRVGGEPRSAAVHLGGWRGEEATLASGCEAAILADPVPAIEDRALAAASDAAIAASVESVIVRGSRESWAEDAHWDEYRVRVRATGSAPLQVTAVRLVDAQGRATEANRPLCPDGQPLLLAAREPLRAELARRLTPLPLALAPSQEAMLDLFFSMSPPPVRAEIEYTDERGRGMLRVDTLPIFQATTP
jgi:hypothetical protein